MKTVLVDTGPLVAFLNRRDRHHVWIRELLGTIDPPLRTCEAVVSESCFLVRNLAGGPEAVLEMITRGIVSVDFSLADEVRAIQTLMKKYANVPMSLADACLVRMTELHPDRVLLTVDADFRVYRRNRRRVVPVLMPG